MSTMDEDHLKRIKQKVDAREDARKYIQKKKQERYEAQLMELEAKKREEEMKRQHMAEFNDTMKQLKKKAMTHKAAPAQRPPSLLSKMHRASHTAAFAKSNIITKTVQSTDKISPKTLLSSPHSSKNVTARRPSLENSPHKSARGVCKENQEKSGAMKGSRDGVCKENVYKEKNKLHKENSFRESNSHYKESFNKELLFSMNGSQGIRFESNTASDNWLLKKDEGSKRASKDSSVKAVKGSPRKDTRSAKPCEGLQFSSRTEKQQILESCKSSIMKPVIAPPQRLRPELSLDDLQRRAPPLESGSGDAKMDRDAHKRKTDQVFAADLKKKSRSDSQQSRSVLVSSVTSDPNSKYYHFSYVHPPTPSPLNVSLCSEFNETSSSNALQEFNSKVEMLKKALSEGFTKEAVVRTVEKSLDREAVSKLNAPTTSVKETPSEDQTQSSRQKPTHNDHQHPTQSVDTKDWKENQRIPEDIDLTYFRDPTPFNFTSAMKARLNMLTSERHREKMAKTEQSCQSKQDTRHCKEESPTRGHGRTTHNRGPPNLNNTEDISDMIAQYVENCQRNVAQLRASSGTQDLAAAAGHAQLTANPLRPGNWSKKNPMECKYENETDDMHCKEETGSIEQSGQYNTFSVRDPRQFQHSPPLNQTYDRALKPLPLNVEDLKLQFRTTSSNSANSSCFEFSELRQLQSLGPCTLNTSQVPERDITTDTDNGPDQISDVGRYDANQTINAQEAYKQVESRPTDRSVTRRINDKGNPTVLNRSGADQKADPSHETVKHRKKPEHRSDKTTSNATRHSKHHTYDVTDKPIAHDVPSGNPTHSVPTEPQEKDARKKSAFYAVPPSQHLTQPDLTLSPRRKQLPMEVNFRRISSTPTSSLKSLDTFKDTDSMSEILQLSCSKVPTNEVKAAPTITKQACPKPVDKGTATKSVAIHCSLLSQSCTSDTLCEPLSDLTLGTADVKDKLKTNGLDLTVKHLNSPKFSLELLDKMIKAEEERQKQSKLIVKLKSKAVTDKIMAELSRIELEKKTIKESCKTTSSSNSTTQQQSSDRLRNLKKKQRGLLIKLNQEREHLNTMAKQLLSQSQERIQQLTSQYNHLRTQLDTKAVLKVIDDSFKFHDDVTDTDCTMDQVNTFDMELSYNAGKLKSFCSLPEGLDRGQRHNGLNKPTETLETKYLELPSAQPKILKDRSTSPLLPPTDLPLDTTAPTPSTLPQTKRALPPSQPGAPIPMRAPLYPKYLRRLSSGSDDSFIYSHNETISDQSDLELRIRTLKDQLNKRRQEAERLKKELKTVRAENLKAKEASLLQQIRFYDKHIQLSSQELESEKQNSTKPAQIMRKPLILKPQKKINATKTGNMSSVEENSDQTHSSHDYHKETFDTESDKLDASDSTTVKDKEESLEPRVHATIGEEHKVAEETASGENTLKCETINEENVHTSLEITSAPEEMSTELNESVDETLNKLELETISNREGTLNEDAKSVVDVVEQIETASTRYSESASEIQTEVEEQSSREEIEEELTLPSSEQTVETGQDVATDRTKYVSSDEPFVETARTVSSEETNVETDRESVKTSENVKTDRESPEINVETGKESIEAHVETGRESIEMSGDVKTERETSLETDVKTGRESTDRSNIETETQLDYEGDYEEKDHESEVLHVSLKERTIYETFIVHEESVETREERASSEEDIEEEISESDVKEEKALEATNDVLKPLYLSPRELELPLKETSPREDEVSVKEITPTEDITTERTEDATVESNEEHASDIADEGHFLSHSEPKMISETKQPITAVQTFASAAMPELSPADISDILSPNISDLHDILDKDFINLDNFSLPLQLSPSKAPHTPFLHALSRDYHMTRKYQLEQLSNEIVDNELNTSIESMLVVYKERCVLNAAAVNEVEAGDVGEKEMDVQALGSHQRDLSWTSEDDWYTDEFDLELAGPPSVVAQVLLQKERQIDQEIEKIKQLTSNISSLDEPGAVLDTCSPRKLFSGAYPYLRHIPDKPPPPYIEPATSVPSSEGEISTIVLAVVDSLMNPDKEIEIPSSNIHRIQMYHSFLYDLTKDVYTKETTSSTTEKNTLPWQKPRVTTKLLDKKQLAEPQVLSQRIVNRVCQLLFLQPTPSCNNFILDWSRPKRDPVDEIIVQEARVEESMWTGYHNEETEIKNQVTETLLQELLDETVGIFQGLLTRGRSKA
uniref:Centrosome-associated protein 350 n=1 Tax=Cacopsylla melanoneura TaxID=428564 RepID=A0A8D9E1Y6_9HEMI